MTCRGKITREYTVWCHDCQEWETCATEKLKKHAELVFKRPNGWRKSGGKWRCLDCHNKGKSNHGLPTNRVH